MLLIDVVPKVGEFPEAVGTNLFLLLLHVRSQMLPLLTMASWKSTKLKTKLTLNDQIDQIYHLLLIVKKYFSISELFRHAKNHLVSFQMIWDSGRSHPQFQHNSHIFPRP